MEKRIVEKYSDFLKTKIDPEVSRKILALNDDKEFKDREISINQINESFFNYDDEPIIKSLFNFIKRSKIYIEDKGSKRVFLLFEIKYQKISYPTSYDVQLGIPIFISILKMDDGSYRVLKYTHDWIDFEIASRRIRDIHYQRQVDIQNTIDMKTINEIIDQFKSIIPLHDEMIKIQTKKIEKNKKEEIERVERNKKFISKFTKQFILDEFSNVFDLCGVYEIDTIRPNYPIYITLHPEKKEYSTSHESGTTYMKVDSKIVDIMDELASTRDRLEEEGLNMGISIGKSIIVKLTEILPEPTNEGIKDLFKKNPVNPEVTKEILDLNNSERFKKNNIKIEKLDLKPTGKFIFKYGEQAHINNMISFKAIFPESINCFDEYGFIEKINSIYIHIRNYKRTTEYQVVINYSLYSIDYIFGKGDRLPGFFLTSDIITEQISNYICSIYENHLKNESDKKQKDSHQKTFFEKFDEQYIKDIFADVLTLCSGSEINQIKSNQSNRHSPEINIGGYYLLKIPLKTKKDTSSHKMNHVYDDLVSEVFEELSVARDRLRDDNLIMSFDLSGGSLSTNPTLYIIIRDKIKQDEEDYVPQQAPYDGFP